MTTEVGAPRALSDTVAEEIRASLGRQRISKAELGRRLGVSEVWVGRRLNGQLPIGLDELQKIADAIGVNVLDLLPKRNTAGYAQQRVVATIGEARTRNASPIIRPHSDEVHRPPNRPVRQTRPTSRIENRPMLPVTV